MTIRHPSPSWIAAVVAALLVPASALAADSNASCSVASGSLVDSVLNGPEGEDENFLGAKNRGLPQIVFAIDASPHMRKLPQDLDDPQVRMFSAAADHGGCSNTVLDDLVYRANPCIDAKGKKVGTTCDATTKLPNGWLLPYASWRYYAPYDPVNAGLFDATKAYVYDYGWGTNSKTAPGYAAATACTTAGLNAVADATLYNQCQSCVSNKGYWLPPDSRVSNVRPVVAGNWLNFNPPKYVLARRVLKDQFAAMDFPSRNRQAMVMTVTSDAERCFSDNRGSAGMDPPRDGADVIGNPTRFKPPCNQFASCLHNGSSGGGRDAFDNAVDGASALFTSPTAAPAVAGPLPGGAPTGTASLSFVSTPDGIYRGVYKDGGGTVLREAICAPYAETLLNAGQYLSDPALYDTQFAATAANTWEKAQFIDAEGTCPASSCKCPRPTVILIAGGSPDFDDNLPCEITGIGCTSKVEDIVSEGACGAVGAGGNLARVARFLATTNVQPNRTDYSTEKVSINTFVIGIGTRDPSLVAAAEAGNGQFIEASDAQSLRSAINEALDMIASAELSFSNANVTAVQTRAASSLVVPRFTPRKKSFWPGKLSVFELFSEDACGCLDKKAGCDANNDGQCGGMFFKDADGSFIAADSSGEFRKTSTVGPNGEFVASTSGTVARPFWEASKEIPADNARKIYTVIDANDDGMFDYSDSEAATSGQIEFTVGNVDKLLPYMNLTVDFCGRLAGRIGATLTQTQCAERVIQYVRGIDIFDEDCDEDRTELRANRLGDIFHSSPVVVEPPTNTRSPICRLGLSTQCLVSLDSTAVSTDTADASNGTSAYDTFLSRTVTINAATKEMRRRDRFILVGANDGMLHAFDFGQWGKDDPSTTANECPDEANGICPGYFNKGLGTELWGFIPPDMLPKLQRMIEGRHQYFVDGTPMVREIWADLDGDFKKDAAEFKTMAVVGERRGGIHYFALDVTHPRQPKFRWMFPQPNTLLARASGESFTEFLPTPPPIGPIRVRNDASPHKYDDISFEERWVVFLSGGYDQSRIRGRMVNVIDAWWGGGGVNRKGRTLWTWSPTTSTVNEAEDDDDDDAPAGARGYSFAATPGLIAYGKGPRADSNSNGYYFDTATVGDTGGQLWTLRFNNPDNTRWAGGLAFRASNGTQCSRQPIFQVTANVISYDDGRLQTLIGTGDRFNLRDRGGGECSQQNLLACVRRGCTLTVSTRLESCTQSIRYQRSYTSTNTANTCALTDTAVIEDAILAANCCDYTVEAVSDYAMVCKNSDSSTAEIEWTKELTCKRETSGSFTGFTCEVKKETPFDICSNFDRCTDTSLLSGTTLIPKNAFYSVKTFDPANVDRDAFNGPTGASTYTTNNYTTASAGFVQVDPYDAASTVFATDSAKGWWFPYSGEAVRTFPAGFDPTNATFNERTASQATVFGGCSFFNTFTPARTTSLCGDVTNQGMTTRYRLHYKRGDACQGVADEAAQKYASNNSLLPEAPDQLMLTIRPDGMVSVGVASMPREGGRGGATTTGVTEGSGEPSATFSVGLDRNLHECRHPEGAAPDDYAGQRLELQTNKACQ